MVCRNGQQFDDAEFLKAFGAATRRDRIPLHGSMDLTYRCNMRCVHCYAADAGCHRKSPRKELSTARTLSVLDEIAEAGCLFLLLTGGEPLLRKDFGRVYRKAKELGMFVTVFTNGTLIDRQTLDLFVKLPPLGVEISIYGATALAHEAITGVKGSFAVAMKAVDRLVARGVGVTLKTMAMSLNSGEIRGMERLAKQRGLKFRLDASLFPRLDGDRGPLKYRLSASEAAKIELADKKRVKSWRKYSGRFEGQAAVLDKMYTCGAGVSCFHIDAYGMLFPCLMARTNGYDLVKGKFSEGWATRIPAIRDVPAPRGFRCNACDMRHFCSTCPAAFNLEKGSLEMYYSFTCGMARLRAGLIDAKALTRKGQWKTKKSVKQ